VSGERLARRLGTGDAVIIGLGSMIGSGVFAAFGPAARAAGSGLLIGLGIAALIAYCNATASAQLAAAYPVSGGTYVYGRERLGAWWGFAAGWGFVVGKTASCAAMALTFATYLLPASRYGQRGIAVLAVVALVALNQRGVSRTALLTRILVGLSLTALAVLVLATWGRGLRAANLSGPLDHGVYGILQSAGFLFFAFAGYARIATMGEEVRDPRRTIPRAIPLALGLAVVVYFVVGLSALLAVGPAPLANAAAPLSVVSGVAPVVRAGAAVASLGALLALIAGVGRTLLAMARERDLPPWLGVVDDRYRVPARAEGFLGAVVCVLVVSADLRSAIGFSSFGVLVYYAIANLAAFTQTGSDRVWPRWLNVLGFVGCAVLVGTLPVTSILAGTAVFLSGFVGRAIVLRLR
jgi:APA family basic amino acid/polyamine antiporter